MAALLCLVVSGCGSGSGGTPAPPAPAPSPASVTLSTTSVTFSNVAPGTTSAAQVVTLTNTGGTALSFSGATLGGANATSFAQTNTCGTSVAAGASCTLNVTFTVAANSFGTSMGTLTLADSAATSPQTITLAGSTAVTSQCTRPSGPVVAGGTPGPGNPTPTITGKVMAGGTPLIGASVQLMAAGATGNASTPTALNTAPAITAADGSFSLASGFTCPTGKSMLYLLAKGGQPGASGVANVGTTLALALGSCDTLPATGSYAVDELTTVATAYAFAPFAVRGGVIGATATNFAGLNLAAGTVANLVNVTTGTGAGAGFPATGNAPTAELNSLANALNACVLNAAQCPALYSAASGSAGTGGIGTAPANTLDAALAIAQNPAANVAAVYAAAGASSAYAPALTAAPADWTLFVTYAGGGMNAPSGIGITSTGKVWVGSYFGTASLFSNTGVPQFASGITGSGLSDIYGLAIDQDDIAWLPNEQSSGTNNNLGSMTLVNAGGAAANYTAGGLNYPVAIAVDAGDTSWIVDYGNSHVTLLNNSGTPLSGASGYTTGLFAFPVAVAVDSNCYAYIGNQSSDSITRVAADGSSFQNYAVGNGPSGLAVDAGNNVWTANYYGSSVGLVSAAGVVQSTGGGFTGGGLNHPQGIAIDGDGNVWVANYRATGLTELAGMGTAAPGAALSPSTGLGSDAGLLEAFAVAIDPAGSVWVSNFGSDTITQFVGLAAPVRTPMIGPPARP